MSKLFFLGAIWLSCTLSSTLTGVNSLPIGGMIESSSYDQLGSLVKEYFKMMEKVRNQPRIISGQVNLRAPRSELGDMAHALKLYQLQELDRTFGSKSRPRFGKRNEVIGQNDVPGYGYGYETPENINIQPLPMLLGAPGAGGERDREDMRQLGQQQQQQQQRRRR